MTYEGLPKTNSPTFLITEGNSAKSHPKRALIFRTQYKGDYWNNNQQGDK